MPFIGYIPATINVKLYGKEGDLTKQLMWECIAGAQLFAPFGSPLITGIFLVGAGFFTYCDGYEEMQSSWEAFFDDCLETGKTPLHMDLAAYKDVILLTFECFMGGLMMMNGGLAVADGIREMRAAAEMRTVTESTNAAKTEIVEVSESGSGVDLASYYALKQQGYSASEAYDLMKQFRNGINPNDEFIFHFTTYEGGKGIYAGTTPTPSWTLKHIPIGGWGLGKAPVRIPIKITPDMEIKTPILPLYKTRVIHSDFMKFN